MELFFKATGAVVLCSILLPVLHQRDIAAALAAFVCAMTGLCVLQLLQPVKTLVFDLVAMSDTQDSLIRVLFRILGISIVCEIAAALCADAGSAALGKGLQLLGSAAILYVSMPVVQMFVSVVQEILGGL